MKTKAMITMLVSVAMILTAPLVALGAKGAPGPPSDGGGGGEPPDYGDLIILYRNADGVPILTTESCQQPIAFESDTCSTDVLLGVPIGDCKDGGDGEPPCLVQVDDNCAILPAFTGCTQEVDFGRISDARSDDTVFASQLEDVVVKLATADCITLDPAGRLVASTVATVDGVDKVSSATIDSPLQNLAIYKELMTKGFLGDTEDSIKLPQGATVLDTAARALGAASDKAGWVGVDLVVYLNQIMGLTDNATTTILGKDYIDVKEEVMGDVTLVNKCFLLYRTPPGSEIPYGYGRESNFGSLPNPPYIPETKLGPGMNGWFEVLAPLDVTQPFTATFEIARGPIFEKVFGNIDAGSGGIYAIDDFAQAADDTRAVIDYMHSWPLPVAYATQFDLCTAYGETHYDVSIPDQSGLQVPVQMVDGSEREFIVTVANAGPDAASGEVTVTAEADNSVTIEDSSWTFGFGVPADNLDNTVLAPGASRSWTQSFSFDLVGITKIAWTAAVEAEFDVNAGNDNVYATTSVKVGGGGGKQR